MKSIIGLILVVVVLATSAEECQDRLGGYYCSAYQQQGYCSTRRDTMIYYCPKTCEFCDDTTNAGGNTKHGQCGRTTVDSRIISGELAKKDAWPWQISLYYNGQFMCGGSILSPRWVLTAAHCVDGFDYRAYQIVLGDYDRRSTDGDEQVYRAVQAFHHPQWDPSRLNNDIALIELDRPAVFDDHIQPICLPTLGEKLPTGSSCYITGWGQHTVGRSGPPALVLKQALVKTVSPQTCYNMNTQNMGIPITNQMICAGRGPRDATSGCHGDSGGPFVCKNNGRWVLYGSVSWGSGYCDSSEAYSVFAKISSFRDWIDYYVQY
ncbi:chymotrypsin B-like [Clytia hemisphaerica]|uniref:Uncharacterized protein n=1 Tax=Clytia hemisphaerica TaxID=252671 RepID=A0A7M5VH15_9CNID